MKKLLLYSTLLLSLACTKQGATGPQGPAGAAGQNGNANVVVDTFTLTSAQYAWNSFYGLTTSNNATTWYLTRYHDCPFPAVTADVLATGMVLAFFIPDPFQTPNQWSPLPYSFSTGASYYYNFAYSTDTGLVRIHYFYTPSGGSVPLTLSTDLIATHRFKLVAVSGKIADAMRRSGVDTTDESAVNRFLQ